MKSNLDVWAIQNDKEVTKKALEKVKKDSLGNILYLNCWCDFTIGNKPMQNRLFDACFYSEESDTVVLFAKGKISEEEIEKYLEEANIKYTTIRFKEPNGNYYKYDSTLPEICFVREKKELRNLIDETIEKGELDCVYYPNMESNLSLNYIATTDEQFEVEGRACKGMVVLKDKLILLVNQRDKRNVVKESSVTKLLINKGMKVQVKSNSSIKR